MSQNKYEKRKWLNARLQIKTGYAAYHHQIIWEDKVRRTPKNYISGESFVRYIWIDVGNPATPHQKHIRAGITSSFVSKRRTTTAKPVPRSRRITSLCGTTFYYHFASKILHETIIYILQKQLNRYEAIQHQVDVH